MSYTIVGMFPNPEMADKASDRLDSAGFAKEDYKVSGYTTTGNAADDDYDYEEDEKAGGFWNWLFGEDHHDRHKYSYAATKSNVVTVYTEDLDRAEKARDIMNDAGAINVNDFTKNYMAKKYNGAPAEEFTEPAGNSLSADERARIINKAKNNLYFIENDRKYTVKSNTGITDEMDSLGNENTRNL